MTRMQSSDAKLRSAVFLGLGSDPSVKTRSICVGVSDGAVTLSGWVTSNVQKSAAIAAARRVSHVGSVVDVLAVAVPALVQKQPVRLAARSCD